MIREVTRLTYHSGISSRSSVTRASSRPPWKGFCSTQRRAIRLPIGLSRSGTFFASAALSWLDVVLAESWRSLAFCIAISRTSPGSAEEGVTTVGAAHWPRRLIRPQNWMRSATFCGICSSNMTRGAGLQPGTSARAWALRPVEPERVVINA